MHSNLVETKAGEGDRLSRAAEAGYAAGMTASGAAFGQVEGAAVPGRVRALLFVGLATLGALSVWFSANAVATALGDELGFGSGQLAWLTIAVQFVFVAGTLFSAILNLAERVNARLLFAVSALRRPPRTCYRSGPSRSRSGWGRASSPASSSAGSIRPRCTSSPAGTASGEASRSAWSWVR